MCIRSAVILTMAAMCAAMAWADDAADRQPASRPASQPASRPELSAERRAELEAWIGQLGDASFDTREKATEALKQAPEAVPLLVETYRRTKDAEVIERIEQVARSLFFDFVSKASQPGFLGIECARSTCRSSLTTWPACRSPASSRTRPRRRRA
jgi:hypothetical protein